jgi:nucleoside-diphosphate-sugar epimerase
LHLVIGAGEFLGHHVSRALSADVPVIELNADADDQALHDAVAGVEVVVYCAESWSPGRRLRYRKRAPRALERTLRAAVDAGVGRLVHVSTADVYGSGHEGRITERTVPAPAYAFEKLRLFEEEWLLDHAEGLEVVIVRPARVFGEGEDWVLPRLMAAAVRGRVWLPGGGRARQTFVSAEDVGRACLAASERGRPGRRYLIGGFDSSWYDLMVSAARAVGFGAEVTSIPYDLSYLRALGRETLTPLGGSLWPGLYAVDVLGRPRLYDDSHSRRDLTWSPSVGSFEQEMPAMVPWLSQLPEVTKALAEPRTDPLEATSPPGR